MDLLRWPRDTPYPQKLALSSPTSGVVGIVRSWTQATEYRETLSKPQGLVRQGGLGKLKNEIIHLIGSRTHDIVACSIVPYPLRKRCFHSVTIYST
jgi:hypothetical protein